jgi:PAS domain S-box-containing protein
MPDDLRAIVDALPVLVAHIGADLRYRFANRSYHDWFGRDPEEIVGRTMAEILGEEVMAAIRPHIDEVLAGQVTTYETWAAYKHGGTRFVHAVYTPRFGRDGRVTGFIAMVADATRERRADERLHILAEASDVLSSSLDVRVTMPRLAHLVVPRLGDWCAVDVVHPDGRLETYGVARAGEVERREPPSLGEKVTGDLVRVPITSRRRALGAITVVSAGGRRPYGPPDVEVLRELASRAAMALENARLFEAAQEATRRKDQFLAMLGHELRNPLAPIVTALELMKLRGDPSHGREREVIERQVGHLVRLVDDLLDVARLTRGLIRLSRAPVETATVVGKAVEMAAPILEERGHRLVLDVPREGLRVDGDLVRLAQVVVNLLTNAAKYTEPGGEVSVAARRVGREVEIAVSDDGIGIDEPMLQKIFDLFVQGQQALDRSEGGLGIGLTLVRSLVDMHGGRVTAHSEGLGTGSTFTVTLPTVEARAEAPTPAARRPIEGASRRVLVVDDNEDAALILGDALRAAGHEVEIAHDGPGAIYAMGRFDAEIALLDIGLPVMDGYELARRLRDSPRGSALRLIAVTGYGAEEDQRRTREAGFEHHFVKPLDLDDLLVALAR